MKSVGGIFIQASDDQLAAIWEAVAAHGFPSDSSGILSLLMLAVEGEDDEEDNEEVAPNPLDAVLNHFAGNPEQAEALRSAGAKLFQRFFTKKP